MFKVKRSTYNNTTTFAINEYTLKKKKFICKYFLTSILETWKQNPFQCYQILKTPNLFLLLLFTIGKITSFDLVVDLCEIDVAPITTYRINNYEKN